MAQVVLLFTLVIFGAKGVVSGQFEDPSSFRLVQEGDYCVLGTGETGVCRRSELCDWRQPRVYHRWKNIAYCRTHATEHIICCPPARLSGAEFATKACRSLPSVLPRVIPACSGCQKTELPFIAALGGIQKRPSRFKSNPFIWVCGSSLITPSYLLTAAHCFQKIKPPMIARMGTSNLLENKEEKHWIQDRNVMSVIMHPRFRSLSKENDIALVLVDYPFIYSDRVTSVCLSTSQEDMAGHLYAAGWGMTERRNESPDQLLGTRLNIKSIDECNEKYENIEEVNPFFKKTIIYDTQFCALGEPIGVESFSDLCPGDSGGPLYREVTSSGGLQYHQVGIISHGVNCGGDVPGVYFRITPFVDWIASVVGTLED